MKKFIFTLAFLSIFKSSFAGCGGLSCSSSNGIKISGLYLYPPSTEIDTVNINSVDSVVLHLWGVGSCGLKNLQVAVNGILINYILVPNYENTINRTIKVLGIPGDYRVSAWHGSVTVYTFFTFILNPVGLPKLSYSAEQIVVFPNPAKDEITISNTIEPLKNIMIYDFSGKSLGKYEVNTASISIPLTDFPPGIYFMHVATLSEKLIIKKVIIF